MNLRRLVAALAVAVATREVRAQNAPPTPPSTEAEPGFTLDDAERAMRRGHPMLDAMRASARAADSDVTAAGLWTNPVLSAVYTRSVGFTTYDPVVGMPQLGVTQLLEVSGLPSARRAAAAFARDAAQADVRATETALRFDLRTAAVMLAEAQARVRVHREAVDDLTRARLVVDARVAAGAAPRYDATRISIALADARALLADAESDVTHARADLDVAVGPLASTLRGPVRFNVQEAPTLPTLASLIERLGARPDLTAATSRASAQRAQIDVARRSVTQGVSVYLGAVEGAGVGNAGERQFDIIAGVSVPLPIVDRGQGTIPAAEQRAEAARRTADAIALAARQRVEALWREVELRRGAFATWQVTGTPGVEEMRHEAEVGYREGRLSILELVDAYTSFRDTRLRGIELSRDARNAEVQLGRAAGLVFTTAQ